MKFAKVHVSLWDSPRFNVLSVAARGLWFAGLGYAARAESDGLIPGPLLPIVGVMAGLAGDPLALAASELEAAGLWDVVLDGYAIHDYEERNETRSSLADAKERRSRGGILRAHNRWCVEEGKVRPDCPICHGDEGPVIVDNDEVPDTDRLDRLSDRLTYSDGIGTKTKTKTTYTHLSREVGEGNARDALEAVALCGRRHSSAEPCRDCQTVRLAAEAREAEADRARGDAARARREAVRACVLCDDDGWRLSFDGPAVRCDHEPHDQF